MSVLEPAFEGFVAQRQGDLLRLGFALTGDRDAAQDLSQRALMQTWLRWSRIQHKDPFVYARKILINDVAKQRQRQRAIVTPTATPPDPPSTSEPDDGSIGHDLLQALLALPPRTRAVVVLRYREDLSERQTSELLGMSLGSVKSHGSRGLAALRAKLGHSTPSSPRSKA